MKQKTEFATPHSGRRSENDAYLTLAALCAQAEHCQYEMLEKMRRWELPEDAQARVMQRLAFVKDKVRYNKWGRRKVEQALWQKHIDEDIRQQVLDEVDDDEYLSVLKPLLQQKRRSTKAANDYELNQKLMRFALSRGFTYDIIRQCLDVDEEEQP